MSGILLGLFTVVLILVSAFLVLIILMQRASANSGMGSALGGGAAESALGGEAGNVLTKLTVKAAVVFFVVAFGLYLGHMARFDSNENVNMAMPTIKSSIEEGVEPIGSGLTAIEDSATTSESVEGDTQAVTTELDVAAEQVKAEAEAVGDEVKAKVETAVDEVEAKVEKESDAFIEGVVEQIQTTIPNAPEPVPTE